MDFRPENIDTDIHAPVPTRESHLRPVWACCVGVFAVVTAWLGLYLATGRKSTFMALFMGLIAGWVYGRLTKRKTNGVIPMMLVFVASVLAIGIIQLGMISQGLGIHILELETHFGFTQLMQVVGEQLNLLDATFLMLAVVAADVLAVKLSRNKSGRYGTGLYNDQHGKSSIETIK